MDKDTKKIIDKLLAQGWRIEQGAKHIKAYPPDRTKPMVVIPGTPSDRRSLANLKAQLRRSGADL